MNSFKGMFGWLKGFFFNYMWLGISFLLVAIIIDISNPISASDLNKSIYVVIAVGLLESIGTAILIASVFSYASSTHGFIEKIRGLLEDIIVKRNFLGNIDPAGKREALKSLIQPSHSEVNKYPNIGNYYEYFINKTLEIAEKSVRSSYQITARAYVDSESNHIAVAATYSYKLFPGKDGFQDITVGYQVDGIRNNSCEQISICTPTGKRELYTKENLTFNELNEGGDVSLITTIPVQTIGKGHDCLDVELKVIEHGSVNSFLYSFKALQPTDGFKLELHCEDPLFIKSHSVFVVGAKYYLDLKKDGKGFSINCNQWINEGTGIAVLIALPDSTSSGGVEMVKTDQQIPIKFQGDIKEPVVIQKHEEVTAAG